MDRQEIQNLISVRAAEMLLNMRDGDAALLYLYLSRYPERDREAVSRDLLLPKQRLNEAFERLEMVGLLPLSAAAETVSAPRNDAKPVIPEASELPEYTSADVASRAEADQAFSALVSEAQLIIGRALSTPDLIKLLGIYDHLDLPPEVMMELMNFVADVYRDKYGERRRPNTHAFEREARIWSERGITDFEAAEQYIRRYRERHSLEGAVKDALDIQDRDFTDTERRYVEEWLNWGFLPEVLAVVYDKAVTNTGKRSLAYMNKILQTWHEKNLHTLQEIREKARPSRTRTESSTAVRSAEKPEDIWKKVDQI